MFILNALLKIPFSLLLLFVFYATVNSKNYIDSINKKPVYIKDITIEGNKKTRIEVVNYFLQIDIGMIFDSSAVKKAKQRLLSSDLFLKVEILTLFKTDGAYLYVILNEGLFFNINDIGGEYYLRKYKKSQFWWTLHLGVENKNFRGKMEVLKTQISFWDSRSLSISWLKPLFPSDNFFSIGLGMDLHPEEARWVDHNNISGRFSFGHALSPQFKVYTSLSPLYDKTIKKSLLISTQNDTSIFSSTAKLCELFTNLSTTLDFRDNNFDTRSGYYIFSDIKTNVFYSGIAPAFYQFTNDFRCYFPTFSDHKIASRLLIQLRDKSVGDYHPLQYGGEGSIRGYLRGEFPHSLIVSDAFVFSAEYRFPIFRFPTMRVPILSNYSDIFRALNYRLDGALIFDYGRMSTSIRDLVSIGTTNIESGTGLGFGLRVMVPNMEKSASIDFVWGKDPFSSKNNFRFYKNPLLYLYVNLLN